MAETKSAITRRDMLIGGVCVTVATGCGVGTSQDIDRPVDGLALLAGPEGVWVPRFMHFGAAAAGPVAALALDMDDASSDVTIHFSDGRQSTYAAPVSFAMSGADLRAGVLVKNLGSWMIDAAWRYLRTRVAEDDYDSLRGDFAALQEQRVLDALTLGALFDLTAQLTARVPRRVTWDGAAFVIG